MKLRGLIGSSEVSLVCLMCAVVLRNPVKLRVFGICVANVVELTEQVNHAAKVVFIMLKVFLK